MVAGRDRGNALVSIALYVEGGGDSKDLKTMCRRGFRMFVEKAGLKGRMPRISACGGRQNTYESFATALNVGDRIPILLVDSEDPLTAANRWEHLRNRDGWARPNGASNDHCHLMVPPLGTNPFESATTKRHYTGSGPPGAMTYT